MGDTLVTCNRQISSEEKREGGRGWEVEDLHSEYDTNGEYLFDKDGTNYGSSDQPK